MRLRINREFLVGLIAVLLGLVAGALLMLATGNEVLEGYRFLFAGALLFVAEPVHLTRAIGRTDQHLAKSPVQRFKKFLTQPASRLDRKIGVIGNVRNAVQIRDFAIKKLAHPEIL